jgi:hypothetical protein
MFRVTEQRVMKRVSVVTRLWTDQLVFEGVLVRHGKESLRVDGVMPCYR